LPNSSHQVAERAVPSRRSDPIREAMGHQENGSSERGVLTL